MPTRTSSVKVEFTKQEVLTALQHQYPLAMCELQGTMQEIYLTTDNCVFTTIKVSKHEEGEPDADTKNID